MNYAITSRKNKRIKKLILICSICAIFLTVSTYAWFVGMKTVNVSSMDVEIATTEGLFLSMDGNDWSYRLDAKNATPYTGNANTWADDGLVPVSTIGEMDSTASRMIMYEKGSLTASKGGYRLLSSRVNNYTNVKSGTTQKEEQNGYVAFDLFIKNLSGNAYYTENNILNEEDIFLTTNSNVKVAIGGSENTGIENSVRVAFAQIGRVSAESGLATVDNITGITCSDVASGTNQTQVTGICRDASIWEPNDTKHAQNAINWYDQSCKLRSGEDVTLESSYDLTSHCSTLSMINPTDTFTPTYAISRVIGVDDNVDIYDGMYNGYTTNTDSFSNYLNSINGKTGTALDDAKKSYKLVQYPYFTDTDKNKIGTNRQALFSLAPNSITKVRVYVYIEGQDIDNYDFASLGKKISVNFGFTKERFTETSFDYDGPSTNLDNQTNNYLSVAIGDVDTTGSVLTNGVEDFYVIGSDASNVSLLSKYNVDVTTNKQDASDTGLSSLNAVTFDLSNNRLTANNSYCDTPANGCNAYSLNGTTVTQNSTIKGYVDNYVHSLNINEGLVSYGLLNSSFLSTYGCSTSSQSCSTDQTWLTSSSYWVDNTSGNSYEVWGIRSNGVYSPSKASTTGVYGVRPVITVAKSSIH